MSSDPYDIIIIGTGAGGGTLAWRLAPTGARILLLERGDYVAREKDNWSSHAVNVAGRYATREVWTDGQGRPLHPHTNYNVGGNTKFYGAALFRLRREDFGEIRHAGERSLSISSRQPRAAHRRAQRGLRARRAQAVPRAAGHHAR